MQGYFSLGLLFIFLVYVLIFLDYLQKLTGTRSDGTLAHIKTYKGMELVMMIKKLRSVAVFAAESSWRSRVTMCARTIDTRT